MLEGNDDEGAIHLLINPKCTMIVTKHVSPAINTPYYTSLVFCQTNVG